MSRTYASVSAQCALLALAASCTSGWDTSADTQSGTLGSPILASADSYVAAGDPSRNFGDAHRLFVDGGPLSRSYVQFRVDGPDAPVQSATLRLYVRDPSGDGPTVYATESDWSENSITWDSRPARLGDALDDADAVDSGTWVEYDVTQAVTGAGTYSFELATSSYDGTVFHAREDEQPPELVVEWGSSEAGARIVADTHASSAEPDTAFGDAKRLEADGSPEIRSYVMFEVSGTGDEVVAATLRLWVRNPSSDGPAVYPVTTNWGEDTLTWNERPTRTGDAIADVAGAASGTWIEYDLSSLVTRDGLYAVELASTSSDGVILDSREGANAPQIVVEAAGDPGEEPGDPEEPGDEPSDPEEPGETAALTVELVPRGGASGTQRVNFAVPLRPGQLDDAGRVRVLAGNTELAAARRGLARYGDGSLRSVQIQVEVDVDDVRELSVRIGEEPSAGDLSRVAVAETLSPANGTRGPRVWALLPASWLADSGVAGPQVVASELRGDAAAWDDVCDYSYYDTDYFLDHAGRKGSWLYDRVTVNYRGYARRGDLLTLENAYREAHAYRNGISGTGTDTRIGVPGSASDVKYHYTQGMAIHYLLTGDDRFRETVEDVAIRLTRLWSSPGYNGGADFWTERHAGFALLGYVWAQMVSDDMASTFAAEADRAVDEYLDIQRVYPSNWDDTEARCFAHRASAHGEGYNTWGCSPWMSSILAEALDVYATEHGGNDAERAREAIVKLGRIMARDGLDRSGKPYYWMGVGSAADEVDGYDEHWGEGAYLIALAWFHDGKRDDFLRQTAEDLMAGFASDGEVGQIRSFNWQCRAAVATPYYLR